MARKPARATLAAVPVAMFAVCVLTGAAVGLAAADPPPSEQAPSEQSTVEQSTVEQSQSVQSTVEVSSSAEPSAEVSATGEPTVSQAPDSSDSETGTASEEPSSTPTSEADDQTPDYSILFLTNQARLHAGCPKLRLDPALSRAAARHSRDMARNNYFSHTGSQGLTPIERAQAEGYPSRYVSENVAAGNAWAIDTFVQWMTSPDHRHNILNCKFTEIGIGHAYEPDSRWGHYWTQMLGNPGA